MKLNQSTLAAAALAGLFAAGATVAAQNSTAIGTVISGEKDKCTGKDGCKGKDGCDGKDKKEGEIL